MVTKPRTTRARIAKLEGAKPPEPYEIQIIWLHDWRAGKAGGYTLGDKIVYEPGKPPKVIPSPEGYTFHYGEWGRPEKPPKTPEKTENSE